jgi:hypothetical protein
MASIDLTFLFYRSLAGLMVVLGVALIYRSLFHDRPRGRRRCPKCLYDMTGVPGLRCPECGRDAKRERRLHKTRRRWGWFAVSVLMFPLACFSGIYPQAKRDGWPSVTPTWLLVRLAPMDVSISRYRLPRDPVFLELRERAFAQEFGAGSWRALLDRYFDAHPDEISLLIATRMRWPEDVPLRVKAEAPSTVHVLTRGINLGYCVRLHGTDDAWAKLGACMSNSGAYGPYVFVGVPEAGPRPIKFDYELYINGERVFTTVVDKAIRVGGAIDEVLEPLRDDSVTEYLKRNFDPRLCRLNESLPSWASRGELLVKFSRFMSIDSRDRPPACEFAFRAEILRDGVVVGKGHHCVLLDVAGGSGPPFNVMHVNWLVAPPDNAPDDGTAWAIRIRSDPRLALINDVSLASQPGNVGRRRLKYWDGEFTLPLTP